MQFGLNLPVISLYPPRLQPWEPSATGEAVVRIAQHADTLGFDWLAVPEHIIMTSEMAPLMGPRWPEAVSTIAFLAGATKRIRVVNTILVLPYHNPVILAKAISTLDFLSGGRIILGVGAGHLAREFQILRVPRNERGHITDEYLEAIKVLWASERPAFRGRYVEFDEIAFEPKPVQKPHPPIWIGGNSQAAMRRAARLGDGWIPWKVTPQQLPASLEYIRQHREFAKRDGPFEVVMPATIIQVEEGTHRRLGETRAPQTKDEWLEAIGVNQEAGATGILVSLGHTRTLEDYLDQMAWLAREVMPAFKT